MDRGSALMQGFRAKFAKRLAFIQKTAYATSVLFNGPSAPDGSFSVTVRWKNKDASEGEYTHLFTREYVFGQSYGLGTKAWYVERCSIDFARDVARAVLDKRMGRNG